jgi:hypothetical protein
LLQQNDALCKRRAGRVFTQRIDVAVAADVPVTLEN